MENKTQAAPANEDQEILRRILGRHRPPETDADSRPVEKSALELADIQGLILRRYRMLMVRHFLLTVGNPAQARRQLGRLASGDESDVPQITTADDWHVGFEPGPGDNLTEAYAASIHEISRSRARGYPAAAIILTGWFVAVCLTGRPMIQGNLMTASSAGFCFISLTRTSKTNMSSLQRPWVNSEFAGAVRLHTKSKDPLIGTQNPAESIVVIPQPNGAPIEVTGLSTFVTTKAAAYLFLPNITAIKFIANLGEGL